jgi:hypothetical protein
MIKKYFLNLKGNYSFLEFQDPSLKSFEKQFIQNNIQSETESNINDNAILNNESAWERGLKNAKEMKNKAQKRKLIEKDDFYDKKMNLSLKEYEIEKENDERYINVEK